MGHLRRLARAQHVRAPHPLPHKTVYDERVCDSVPGTQNNPPLFETAQKEAGYERILQRHDAMWHKTFRLLWYLAFVYIAVLGWREHSLRWIIAPLFSMGCLFIAQAYLTKHYPDFAPKLNAALTVLMLAYGVAFTIWPEVVNNFPWTTAALSRAKTRLDIQKAPTLDPGTARAQEVLMTYLRDSSDAEAEDIRKELDQLVQRRKTGAFTPADEQQELLVLARYRRLAERTDAIRRLITEPVSAPHVLENSATTASPAAAKPTGSVGIPPTPTAAARNEQRLSAFRAVLNPIRLAANKRNIAILIDTAGSTSAIAPDQALYGHLKLDQINLITDLFRHDVIARGYFNNIYQGDKELCKLATSASRIDALILGRLTYSFRKGAPSDNDLVSCDITLSCKVINHDGDVTGSDSFRIVGPGFSNEAALERAIELLAEQFTQRILKPLL